MNPFDYFIWGYPEDCVCHANLCTVHELQAEIEADVEEITGAM
jgi:hypothetical protein